MKKILLLLLLIVVILILLPIIGNKLIENILNENIELLKTNGVEVIDTQTKSSYFETKKHYAFVLKDANKLVEYLNQYASEKLPAYTHVMLEGALVGVDLEYSNIPISKALSMDISLLQLSDRVMSDMQNRDAQLNEYIKTFLQNGGLTLHANYDIASKDFSGSIKDIQEEQSTKNGAKVTLHLLGATYSGNGAFLAPTKFVSSVKSMLLKVADEQDTFYFTLQNLSTDAQFESQTTYLSNAKLEKIELLIKTMQNEQADSVEVNASGMVASVSSNMQGIKAELGAKSSMKSMTIHSNELDVNASNFNYEIALHNADKDSLEETRQLVAKLKSDNSITVQEKLQESAVKLLSKGMTLDVKDLSVEKIVVNGTEDLEGLSLKSNIVVKEDSNLETKIKTAPMLVLGNFNVTTKLQLSKPFFTMLLEQYPAMALTKEYAKEDAKSFIYDFSFIDGALKLNDKLLK